MVYIRETGRRFEMREKEHMKDLKQLEEVNCTRRKEFFKEIHQSALTDHVASKNHTIDWEGLRLLQKNQIGKRKG